MAKKVSHYRESSLNRIKNRQPGYRFFTNFLMSTRILYVRIQYSMYDLIFDVISCCVWSCDMGNINVYDKIVMKKGKKENMEIEKITNKSPSIRRFWNIIYSLLMRADARGSADTIYCMWRISLLCGSGIVNDVTKVGHAQNIYYQRILLGVLDSYFHFMEKSNLVGNL